MIHLVLVQIIDASKAMKSAPKLTDRRSGAVKILRALGRYAEFFDHPGWRPIKH